MKNLDKSIRIKALRDSFSAFGNILSCKGVMRPALRVIPLTQEAADKAIEKMKGMTLSDHKVSVGRFKSRKEREAKREAKEFNNVYIKNFGEEVDNERLKELFSQFGKTLSVKDANKALEETNGKAISGKVIFLGRAQNKVDRQALLKRKFEQLQQERISRCQGVNLYIKNLDDTSDDEKFRKSFLLLDQSPVLRGRGRMGEARVWLCLLHMPPRGKAEQSLSRCIVGSKPLCVTLAQRKAHLTNQYKQRVAGMRVPPTNAILNQCQPALGATLCQQFHRLREALRVTHLTI
eukprot:bmy_17308T0